MSEYLQPTPLSWIGEQLREKTKRGERYTMEDAVQSYLLDQLRGIDRDKSSYARMWSWGRATLYRHWEEIKERAEAQRTFYRSTLERGHGGTPGETDVRHSRDTPRDKKGPSEDAEAENRTPGETNVRHERDTDETPYISESLDNKTKELEDDDADRARTRGDPFSFLDEKQRELYLDDLLDLLEKYPSHRACDKAYNRLILTHHREPVPTKWLLRQSEEHGWEKVLAAMWITAQAADHPGQSFMRSVLNEFDQPTPRNGKAKRTGARDAGRTESGRRRKFDPELYRNVGR